MPTRVPTRRERRVPVLTQLRQHSASSNFTIFACQMGENCCLTVTAFSVILLKPSLLLRIRKESDGVLRGKKAPFGWRCPSCLSHYVSI